MKVFRGFGGGAGAAQGGAALFGWLSAKWRAWKPCCGVGSEDGGRGDFSGVVREGVLSDKRYPVPEYWIPGERGARGEIAWELWGTAGSCAPCGGLGGSEGSFEVSGSGREGLAKGYSRGL